MHKPPSHHTPHLRLADPHRMQQSTRDLTPDVPRQVTDTETLGGDLDLADALGGLVLRLLRNSVVAGAGTGEHPLTPVVVPESGTELEVVAPLFKLAGSGQGGGSKPEGFAVVAGGRVGCDPREPAVDEVADVLVEDARADTRTVAASDGGAGVGHEPFGVDGPLQCLAAVRAPRDTGEKTVVVSSFAVTDALHPVRGIPQRLVDEWLPRVRDTEAARTDERPDVRLGPDDRDERRSSPGCAAGARRNTIPSETVGDRAPTLPSGPLSEDPADHVGLVGVDEGVAVSVACVPVRRTPREPAGRRCTGLCDREVLVGLVALPLAHQQQQPEHRAAHRRRRVNALRHTDNTGAVLVQLPDRDESTDQRSGEPVQTCDDNTAGLAGRDPLADLVHAGAVHRAAGLVEVLVPLADRDAVQLGPASDTFALGLRRLEPFSGSSADDGHADVAVEDFPGVHAPGIVYRFVRSRLNESGPHMEAALPWLKVDDAMGEHRKTRRALRLAGLSAFGLHALALLHCSRYLTDGFIDEEFVEEMFDVAKTRPKERKATIDALVSSGQWVPCDDGWHLHDYLEHNPSRAEVEAKRAEEREKKSKAGKAGAEARWGKAANGSGIAPCHEPAKGSPKHSGLEAPMAPSRPVPYPEG